MLKLIEEQILVGVAIFVLMAVILLAVLRFTRHYRIVREKIKAPLIIIFLLVTFFDIFYILGRPLPGAIEQYYYALLYLSVAILLIRVAILLFFDLFLVRSKKYRAPKLLKEISGVVLYSVALAVILQVTLKIQVTTVLATSAIITVVLGLALQETLGNLFAGLAIHLDPPYQVGDWIEAGTNVGRVEEITWRATKLRTTDNDVIVIPNGHIAKETLVNHSYPRTPHATRVHVGVSYTVPPNKVADVVTKVLSDIENVTMDPPPEIRVNAYQDFSVDYQIKFFYKDFATIEPTLAQIRKGLWYHFRRNEIEIPFPIRNLHLHDREERLSQKEQTLRRLSDSLKKVYLFSSLDDEERHLIAEHLTPMHFATKEMIIREGESGDAFFIIDQGEVEIFLTSAHGNRKILTTLSEGDFFGEIALLTGEKRTASVQAITDVLVHALKKESFKDVLEKKPDILDEIGSVLSKRKDQLVDLMAESTGGHGESTDMSTQEVKSRILSRIRNYFGL